MIDKKFIIFPGGGLCNQLWTISKSILLGHKYNRSIYFNNFEQNVCDKSSWCNINEVLDIEYINKFLINNNINTKIISKLEGEIKKINLKDKEIIYRETLDKEIEENINVVNLNLGNPVNLCISKSFNLVPNDKNNLYYLICKNLKFQNKFYILKDKIKKELNLIDYVCIHLRIEDDAINYFSRTLNLDKNKYNTELLEFYENEIKKHSGKKIYIASGILKFHNTINYNYYVNLMQKNKNLCDKKDIVLPNKILNKRELIAIIDFLICMDSDFFIGSAVSSFSVIINYYHKNSKMFLK